MITAHTLIKNEENFIWYSICSIAKYVDQIFIWDTGSTDNTNEIVRELIKKYKNKIHYRQIGEVDATKYSSVRQQMLEETKTDWIFILDGDEVWWDESIKKVVEKINNKSKEIESVVVPTVNLIGDMFHYQEEKGGRYKFGNKIGHYNLRFINKNIPGLHVGADYGKEGFFDSKNQPIQNRDEEKVLFINSPYIHTTHLERSSGSNNVMQRKKKLKHEIGIEFEKDFYYPEAFFEDKPKVVPNIWKNMDLKFKIRSYLETPLRKIKRRII